MEKTAGIRGKSSELTKAELAEMLRKMWEIRLFEYNIGSVPERRIVVLDVAPDAHHIHPVRSVYPHTNHYRHLPEVEQAISSSSEAKLRWAEEAGAGGWRTNRPL
jgi:hypothetical protein